MGLFKQKKSKFWWMSLRVNGKRVKISTKAGNKQLAEKIYAKRLLAIEEGRWFPNEAKNRTFEELKDRYMRDHSRVRKTPSSTDRDEYSFKHLSGFFGGLTLADIS
ncbi:MAG: site-specific integrase, partial [Nitrospirae bacterium]|nr:site-specific integrase [Nitrospirota bacterium]